MVKRIARKGVDAGQLLLSKSEADFLTSQLKLQHISVNQFITTTRGAHYRASGLVLVPLRRPKAASYTGTLSHKRTFNCEGSPTTAVQPKVEIDEK